MRIVKEVALDAPGFVVDLLPHGAGLDVDFPAIELKRTEAGLGRGSGGGAIVGRHGRPGVALAIENLFAVEGNCEVVHIFDDLVDLALAEVEFLDGLADVRIIVFGAMTMGPSERNRMPDLPGSMLR